MVEAGADKVIVLSDDEDATSLNILDDSDSVTDSDDEFLNNPVSSPIVSRHAMDTSMNVCNLKY